MTRAWLRGNAVPAPGRAEFDDGRAPVPLPIEVRASVAHLVHSHGSMWDVVAVFELGG